MTVHLDEPLTETQAQRLRNIAEITGVPLLVCPALRSVTVGGCPRKAYGLIARLAAGGV